MSLLLLSAKQVPYHSKPLHAKKKNKKKTHNIRQLCQGQVRGHFKLIATDQWGEKHWYKPSALFANCWCQVLYHKHKNVRVFLLFCFFALTQTKAVLQSRPRILMNDNSWCYGGVHSNRSFFSPPHNNGNTEWRELIWAVKRKGPNYEILHV